MSIEKHSRRDFLRTTTGAAAGVALVVTGLGAKATGQTAAVPVARTSLGRLRGAWIDGIAAFRGVPFAAPPVGRLRFAPPAPVTPWKGVRDATQDGPIAPQPPSRAGVVMGARGEDCLSLTICTPAPDGARRPVFVWLHGGGYSKGSGSQPGIFGSKLAKEGDVVVVGANYRLGALGYLYWPGVSPGNLGSLDQLSALLWVREHIAAFGGDPERVTVAGQSGGAMDIVNLMAVPSARGLFQRAILQSAALGYTPPTAEEGKRIAGLFIEQLGIDPAARDLGEQLRAAPVERLLAAQVDVASAEGEFSRWEGAAGGAPPFRPVADGHFFPASLRSGYPEQLAGPVDVMAGTTREESSIFFAFNKQAQSMDVAAAKRGLAGFLDNPDAAFEVYARHRPGAPPIALFGDALADWLIHFPTLRFAQSQASHGRKAFVYQFDWQSPTPGIGAPHTAELPFVFGTLDVQRQSPMIAGGDTAVMEALSSRMRRAWIGFIRDGDPNHDGLPPWRPYESQQRMTMRFDTVCGCVGDLAGYSWRWPAISTDLRKI